MKALGCQAAAPNCCEGSLQHPQSIAPPPPAPRSPWKPKDGLPAPSPALNADERASAARLGGFHRIKSGGKSGVS